jgi:hypothetical protein
LGGASSWAYDGAVTSMYLSPADEDRLRVFAAAELARRTLARGLRLNAPEAVALHELGAISIINSDSQGMGADRRDDPPDLAAGARDETLAGDRGRAGLAGDGAEAGAAW